MSWDASRRGERFSLEMRAFAEAPRVMAPSALRITSDCSRQGAFLRAPFRTWEEMPMKRLLVTIGAASLGLTATPAQADHYHNYYHHHDHDDDAAVAAVVGGVIGA